MKLENLNSEIKTLNGTLIADILKDRSMTYRSALVSICEMHRPNRPGSGEALKAFDLGLRILKSEDSLELDKSELIFLKKMLEESSIFLSIVIGRLIHFIDDASFKRQKVEEEKKK